MKKFPAIVLALSAFAAQADFMDRPGGIRFGTRMVVRPHVSVSSSWDSNVDSVNSPDKKGNTSLSVSPGANFEYRANRFDLTGSIYYQYHTYLDGDSRYLNHSSYGQSLGLSWSNTESGRGWSLSLSESFSQTLQDDDMSKDGGKGIGRDRRQFNFAGALSKRFNDHWHAGLSGSTYYLDYDNDRDSYGPLYGWGSWSLGGNVGYTLSKWADFFVSGSYSGYWQDNDKNRGDAPSTAHTRADGDSNGWSLHGGFASYMTERIKYSLSAGASGFRYGGEYETSGFTYQGNLNWTLSETWHTMLLLSSYYSPSERDYGASMRTDTVSWGLSHSMVRGKMSATFDLAYRHETHEETAEGYDDSDYDMDILTSRFGLSYSLNRFLSVFTSVEYQTGLFGNGERYGDSYDYDRWRATLGFTLSY